MIDGRRHENHLELGMLREQLLEFQKKEVSVNRSFVDLSLLSDINIYDRMYHYLVHNNMGDLSEVIT